MDNLGLMRVCNMRARGVASVQRCMGSGCPAKLREEFYWAASQSHKHACMLKELSSI